LKEVEQELELVRQELEVSKAKVGRLEKERESVRQSGASRRWFGL
jgi:hypothetical protein